MKIEVATKKDIPYIIEIANKVWPSTYLPILGKQQLDYMLQLFYNSAAIEKQMEEQQRFFICIYNDCPIGFAAITKETQNSFKLQKLYILPEYQGIGAGYYFLEFLIELIKNETAKTLILNVNRYNEHAIKFYKKKGFVKTKEVDIEIGNGYYMNDYIMELLLI